MSDYLFRGDLAELDPELNQLAKLEAERQFRKLILIPSESTAPLGVREGLASAFQNLYAEGYPDESTRRLTEDEMNFSVETDAKARNARLFWWKA